jgi:hypothetical protein
MSERTSDADSCERRPIEHVLYQRMFVDRSFAEQAFDDQAFITDVPADEH